MQNDLETNYPNLDIQILGINSFGQESGAASFFTGRDRPLLQDVDADDDGASDLWVSWEVEPRDVVILDATNIPVGSYNLTVYDLEDASNYAALRQMLVTAAFDASTSPWQNPIDRFDVNDDGSVSPVGDVLVGINELNHHSRSDPVTGKLPSSPIAPNAPPPYLDVNGDGFVTAAGDVLPVINRINNPPAGEGEAAGPANAPGAIDVVLAATPAVRQSVSFLATASPAALTVTESILASSETEAGVVEVDKLCPTTTESRDPAALGRQQAGDSPDSGGLEALLATLAEDLASVWYR